MNKKCDWVYDSCCICGEGNGDELFVLKQSDAPEGRAILVRCKGCGLIRLNPRPGDRIISDFYPPDAGAYMGRKRSNLKQHIWDLIRDVASGAPGRGRVLRHLRPMFKVASEWLFDINVSLDRDPLPSIIDIGCGFGDLLLYWKSRGAEVLGLDFNEKAVKMGENLGLQILHGDLTQQKLPGKSFDVAVLNHSLEHFPNPVAILQETARILRPGGAVHISVPNGASAGLTIYKGSWQFLTFPLHFWFFDCETLSRCLFMSGFQNISIRTSNLWRGYISTFKIVSFSQLPRIIHNFLLLFAGTIFNRKHHCCPEKITAMVFNCLILL